MNMTLYTTDQVEWDATLERMPVDVADIYFSRTYFQMHEANGDGVGLCFVYEDGGRLAMYPFIKNVIVGYDLSESYYDIESAYGYGGPISNTEDRAFLEAFEKSFLDYCQSANIVAEFVRFHPVLKNEKIFQSNIDVFINRKTIYLNMDSDLETIWLNDITSKNRNMIRKAEKNGLSVGRCHDKASFIEIYKETMAHCDADSYYYFSDAYFEALFNNSNCFQICVRLDNEVIASSIFMRYGPYLHYHLSGSRADYRKFAPNNMMLWEVIKLASREGVEVIHFGGGRSAAEDDSLFKFKRSFSNNQSDFMIGKRVHNESVYAYLINKWIEKTGRTQTVFLQYKMN